MAADGDREREEPAGRMAEEAPETQAPERRIPEADVHTRLMEALAKQREAEDNAETVESRDTVLAIGEI